MRRVELFAIVVGLAVAAMMLVGTVSASQSAPAEQSAEFAPQSPVAVEESVEVVVPPPPPPVVDALPASVAGALAANGNTELIARDELEALLPASVVAVLMEQDAVLRVADEVGSPAP